MRVGCTVLHLNRRQSEIGELPFAVHEIGFDIIRQEVPRLWETRHPPLNRRVLRVAHPFLLLDKHLRVKVLTMMQSAATTANRRWL